MADTDAFFTPPPTTDYTLTAGADGDGSADVSERARHAASREQHGLRAGCSTRATAAEPRAPRAAVARAAAMELRRGRARRPVPAARNERPDRAARSACRITICGCRRNSQRADYIVSSNIVRTLQVCRQAVLDARRAIAWLHAQGYDRIGILGTSLGSCLSLLTTAHEPLIRAQALNHISPYFADVVWRGLSTAHVRAGLDGHIELDLLRELWQPISPRWYLDRRAQIARRCWSTRGTT